MTTNLCTLICELEKLAELYYQRGADIEAAILYEALNKAYLEAGQNARTMEIACLAKARTLRAGLAPGATIKVPETRTAGQDE